MPNSSFTSRWASHGGPWGELGSLDLASCRVIAGKMPLWRVINWSLASQQTQEFRITAGTDFYVAAISGSSQNAAGFKANLYDAGRRRVLIDVPASQANIAGAAGRPLIIHSSYLIKAQSSILVRIQNLAPAVNTGQLVLFGFGDYPKSS